MLETISIAISIVMLATSGFLYWKLVLLRRESRKNELETKQKLYELGILKELSDRVGYSLNIEKIIDVISGSLKQLIEYNTVSYMLIGPEKIKFKISLDSSVSREFIDDVQSRMLRSMSALVGKEFTVEQIEETVTGSLITDGKAEPVRSFFNIPLVIDGIVVGVLTVADTREGLYKEQEMTILHKITNQATLAVTRLDHVVKNEQEKLNAMVESMNEGVVMTDMDYRVLVINPAAQKALNISDIENVSIFDFIERMGASINIRRYLDESTRLKKVVTIDNVIIGEGYYQIFVAPVRGHVNTPDEKVLGSVIIFHDRSHEKELERMRKDFTSMMVHELRSPLDSIKKIGEMMRGDMIRNSRDLYDEYVKMIYKSSSQMLELVNDLLDVAKLESGKFELRIQATNPKQILKERLQFFHATAIDAEVKLGAVFGSDIPETVDFDPFRISQVMNNLLSNALKFTEPNGKVTIQVLRHKKGLNVREEAFSEHIDWFLDVQTVEALSILPDSLIIAVTDTGPGIEPDNVPKLFNKFSQFGAGERSDKKGTGLGLVISKGIIQAHNGIIGLGSKKGVGSTFYFTLILK